MTIFWYAFAISMSVCYAALPTYFYQKASGKTARRFSAVFAAALGVLMVRSGLFGVMPDAMVLAATFGTYLAVWALMAIYHTPTQEE